MTVERAALLVRATRSYCTGCTSGHFHGSCFEPQLARTLCRTFKGGRGNAMVPGAGTWDHVGSALRWNTEVAFLAPFAKPFAAGALVCRGAPMALAPCNTSAG